MSETADEARPMLRVIAGGQPTDEELAALVAAIASVTARTNVESGRGTESRWASRQHGLRRPLHPGPGAWKASSLPH